MADFAFRTNPRPRLGSDSQGIFSHEIVSSSSQESVRSSTWQGIVDAVGAVTAMVTTAVALFALLVVISLIINGPDNVSLITLFSAAGTILWALVYRLLIGMLRRSAEHPPTSPLITALVLLVFVLALVLLNAGQVPIVLIFGISLVGAIVLELFYRTLIVPRSTQTRPRNPQRGDAKLTEVVSVTPYTPYSQAVFPEQIIMRREALLRHTVAAIAGILALLTIMTLLIDYGVILPFLITAPLLLLFPFSYLAYVAFQRNVRIERLKRDFLLMEVQWDDELYHQSQGFMNFALHISMAMLMTAIGIALFFIPFAPGFSETLDPLIKDSVAQALRYGFVGAYLFSMQLIYRRYTTYDLQPSVYLYCALTILAGLAFNYAVFEAIAVTASADTSTGLGGVGGGLAAVLAFSLGFFPLLAVQWLTRTAYSAFGLANRRAEDFPLSLIDGISQFHETRLHDQGVDNVQNLAAVDVPSLMINTTFNAQQVVDWVDQANLYLYLLPGEIAGFRLGRIRTVSDFRDWWSNYYIDPGSPPLPADELQTSETMRKDTAQLVQSTPGQLDTLYRATERGPNIPYIMNYWRNTSLDMIEFLNSRYSTVLEKTLFLSDENKTQIQEAQNVVTQLCRASDGKVIARNGKALAGLARLTLELLASNENASVGDRLTTVERGIAYSLSALNSNDSVNQQAIEDLKGLTDAQMKIVEEKVNQAATMGEPGNRQVLFEAVEITERAMQTSRLCYEDKSCNISYACRMADLKNLLAQKVEALQLYRLALEQAQKIPNYASRNSSEYEKMHVSISHIEADLKEQAAQTNAEKEEALQLYRQARDRARKIKNYDGVKLKQMEDAILALEEELKKPAGDAPKKAAQNGNRRKNPPTASGSITEPVDTAIVRGNPILVTGTAGGIADNQITLVLRKQDGTVLDSHLVTLANAEDDSVTWSHSLSTDDYLGDAELLAVAGQNGQDAPLAVIHVRLQA